MLPARVEHEAIWRGKQGDKVLACGGLGKVKIIYDNRFVVYGGGIMSLTNHFITNMVTATYENVNYEGGAQWYVLDSMGIYRLN